MIRIRMSRVEDGKTIGGTEQVTLSAGAAATILSALEDARERAFPMDYRAIDEMIDVLNSVR